MHRGIKAGFRRYPELTVIAVLAAIFLGAYYGAYHRFGYISAPGGDQYSHAVMLHDLQEHGLSSLMNGYPRFFHLVVWGLEVVTGLPALRVMLVLVPIVMLGVALSAGWLARTAAGRWAGVATTAILLFVSYQPWQTLYDGGFPSVIAAGIWLPLWITSTSLWFDHRRKRYLVISILSAILVVLTHHITTGYLVILALLLVLKYVKALRWWVVVGLAFGVLVFLSPLGLPFRTLLRGVLIFTPTFPWIEMTGTLANPNALVPWSEYRKAIGDFALFAGLTGLASGILVSRHRHENVAAYMVAGWGVLLLLGSQVEAFEFPVRLMRDAGIPLAIGAGIFFAVALRSWPIRKQPVAQVALVLSVLVAVWQPLAARTIRILGEYEHTMQFTGADARAIELVGDAPTVSLDAPLPSALAENVRYLNLTEVLGPSLNQDAAAQYLAEYRYVIYAWRKDDNRKSQSYIELLTKLGFTPYARTEDPLKVVMVFER